MCAINNDHDQQKLLRSYRKWSPSEHGATLVWRDVCVYSMTSAIHRNEQSRSCSSLFSGNDLKNLNQKPMKRIINNSTGAVQPGTLMAIMGSRYSNFSQNLRFLLIMFIIINWFLLVVQEKPL